MKRKPVQTRGSWISTSRCGTGQRSGITSCHQSHFAALQCRGGRARRGAAAMPAGMTKHGTAILPSASSIFGYGLLKA